MKHLQGYKTNSMQAKKQTINSSLPSSPRQTIVNYLICKDVMRRT